MPNKSGSNRSAAKVKDLQAQNLELQRKVEELKGGGPSNREVNGPGEAEDIPDLKSSNGSSSEEEDAEPAAAPTTVEQGMGSPHTPLTALLRWVLVK
jgi:hypothetical protein